MLIYFFKGPALLTLLIRYCRFHRMCNKGLNITLILLYTFPVQEHIDNVQHFKLGCLKRESM